MHHTTAVGAIKMEMIDRETILENLVEVDSATTFPAGNVVAGLDIITDTVGATRFSKEDGLYKTIAVDTMLAYNFSKEDCKCLQAFGWFIESEYLVIRI